MNIDELLAQVKQHVTEPESLPALRIPNNWTQGRTVFGGLSGAIAFHAIAQHVEDDRLVRSLGINFIGPIEPEKDFTIEIEDLRQGKNASQLSARIIQKDRVCLLAQAVFGVPRVSKISIPNTQSHGMKMPKKPKFIPQIPKVTPKFFRHFDLAIHEGGFPFTGSKQSQYQGWMKFKKATDDVTISHLIALIDAWPPTVIQLLKWPAPASSMSWNIDFIHPHKHFNPTSWFGYQCKTRQATNGYACTEADVWDESGNLVAISRQTIAVFD